MLRAGLVASALWLGGCASSVDYTLPNDKIERVAGARLAVAAHDAPGFSDMTFTGAIAGAIGGAVGGSNASQQAIVRGSALIAKTGTPDPTAQLAKDLAAYLSTRYSFQLMPAAPISVKSAETSAIAAAAKGKADLVLDLQTVNWSCVYLSTNWRRYEVHYTVRLRLIDARKGSVVTDGLFSWKTPHTDTNPTHGELFDDNAAVLRQQLDEARQAATDYFENEVLTAKS
jgi:hypothetical protein